MNQMQHDLAIGPVAKDFGKLLGAPFLVFLSGGVEEKVDSATGKIITEIVDLPGLISAVLQSRVLHPRKLSGEDLKFIRSALGLRSVEIADVLDVSPEHYCRCEAGSRTLSASTEKFFRMHVYLQAAWKHTALQKVLAEKRENMRQCSPEEAKEALDAFKSLFFEMKLQSVFPAGDELTFYFTRRDVVENCDDRGKTEGKWHKGPLKAA